MRYVKHFKPFLLITLQTINVLLQNNTRRSGPEANAKRAPKSGGGSHNWGNDNDDARKASKEGYEGDDLDVPAIDADEGAEPAGEVVVPGTHTKFASRNCSDNI